jgi:hypothetical protein
LDEDKREVLMYQEMLFENGDMHDDGKAREKKFRWNTDDDTDWQNIYRNIDSDNEGEIDGDGDEVVKQAGLNMDNDDVDVTITNTDTNTNSNLPDKSNSPLANKLKPSNQYRTFPSNDSNGKSKGVCLSNFIVRDERLKDIMSRKRTPPKVTNNSKKWKQTQAKKNHPSIFDMLASHL